MSLRSRGHAGGEEGVKPGEAAGAQTLSGLREPASLSDFKTGSEHPVRDVGPERLGFGSRNPKLKSQCFRLKAFQPAAQKCVLGAQPASPASQLTGKTCASGSLGALPTGVQWRRQHPPRRRVLGKRGSVLPQRSAAQTVSDWDSRAGGQGPASLCLRQSVAHNTSSAPLAPTGPRERARAVSSPQRRNADPGACGACRSCCGGAVLQSALNPGGAPSAPSPSCRRARVRIAGPFCPEAPPRSLPSLCSVQLQKRRWTAKSPCGRPGGCVGAPAGSWAPRAGLAMSACSPPTRARLARSWKRRPSASLTTASEIGPRGRRAVTRLGAEQGAAGGVLASLSSAGGRPSAQTCPQGGRTILSASFWSPTCPHQREGGSYPETAGLGGRSPEPAQPQNTSDLVAQSPACAPHPTTAGPIPGLE